jgi:pimeloyl-ACP methyl ester carboxylesterase
MPLLRINATSQGLMLHGTSKPALDAIARTAPCSGPAIVMVHGYKYTPSDSAHCPHTKIFTQNPRGWPTALGFNQDARNEGIGIAFGWHARGALWQAHQNARALGEHLAEIVLALRAHSPDRPIHVIAHSLGSEIALSALAHLPRNAVNRVILLTGASFVDHALAMLESAAGRTAEVFNITTRENDLFDLAFERLVNTPSSSDSAIGAGINAPNAVTVQLDCPRTLAVLANIGLPVAPSGRRVCHWSTYTRPGVMAAYARLLRAPASLPLKRIEALIPPAAAPRWSRLWPLVCNDATRREARVTLPSLPLALRLKNRIMSASTAPGKQNEHAY